MIQCSKQKDYAKAKAGSNPQNIVRTTITTVLSLPLFLHRVASVPRITHPFCLFAFSWIYDDMDRNLLVVH